MSFIGFIEINSASTLLLAFGLLVVLGIILSLGRRMESAMKLERFGIPIALLAGVIGFVVGPYGAFPLLPSGVMNVWVQLPTPLLTLVFATLMIGRPIPSLKRVWKPVASQAVLALLLGFGQYVVGGIVVLFFLLPYFGVDPLMGCLLEVGFEGGHGAAAIMGSSFRNLGFSDGLDLGLAMATVGLLSSTLIGSGLVVIARLNGWVNQEKDLVSEADEIEISNGFIDQIRLLAINLALAGFAILIGVIFLDFIRFLSSYSGSIVDDVAMAFPVFPLALLGSLLIRVLLEKIKQTHVISSIFQREIGILSTDLLIATAMAGLNLPLLIENWLPITVLAIAGLSWNLFGMLIFARLVLRQDWFERSIAEFGNATGVAASGLLLLRLADPRNRTNTLPIFSIKQLFLQPLLSGGLITVIAPLFIHNFGLMEWTEICGLITIFLGILAFYIQTRPSKASA